ncbi:hypothetical protein [Enterococcus olivae]
MYTYEERKRAVNLYFEYDKALTATIKKLGYLKRATLRKWVSEYSPATRKVQLNSIHYTKQEKEDAWKRSV